MSTSALASGNIPRDGFADQEQRKKKRRNRKLRKSSITTTHSAGRNDQGQMVNKPSSVQSTKTDRRSNRQTREHNSNQGDNDGWSIAGKRRYINSLKNNTRNGKKGKRSVNGTNRRNRGSVAGTEHMTAGEGTNKRNKKRNNNKRKKNQSQVEQRQPLHVEQQQEEEEEDVDDEEVEEQYPHEVMQSMDSTDTLDTTMQSMDLNTVDSRESTETPQSVTDTTNSNTTTSSVEPVQDAVNELNDYPSGLNPEIAEFDPTSLTVMTGNDGSEEQKETGYSVQMSIQMQLFETLQALNLQQQFIQHQIDWVLRPKYAELSQSLAQLRTLPVTDHGTYYLLRQQQQGVEQQISANQECGRQIAEQIEYTRESYLRQVERTGMMQNVNAPSGGDIDTNDLEAE